MVSPRRALEIASWALYDFANTIFSLNILSYHFPLWITVDKRVEEWKYALALSVASFVSALSMPLAGFLSDRTRSRRIPLGMLTMACVAVTACLGAAERIMPVLVLFCFANVFYHSAQVLYNAQIVQLGQARNLGAVSGFGVAVGYVGTVTGLLVTRPFFTSGGHRATFVPTAVLFMVFALPCLLFCPDEASPQAAVRPGFWKSLLGYDPRRLWQKLMQTRKMFYFSLFSFCILNAAAVVIMFMTVFAQKGAHLTDLETHRMILWSSVAAVLASVGSGVVYDRLKKPLLMIRGVAVLWALTFLVNIGFRAKACFFLSAALAGISLGTTWSVTRVFVLELVPRDEVGEYYGIFGLLGRIATLTGPLSLSGLFWIFRGHTRFEYDVVNVFLVILACAGGFFLSRINVEDRQERLEV